MTDTPQNRRSLLAAASGAALLSFAPPVFAQTSNAETLAAMKRATRFMARHGRLSAAAMCGPTCRTSRAAGARWKPIAP